MRITLEASEASGCLRRIGYERQGTAPTDPPDAQETRLQGRIDEASASAALEVIREVGGPDLKRSGEVQDVEFGKGALTVRSSMPLTDEGAPASLLMVSGDKYRHLRDGGTAAAAPGTLKRLALAARAFGGRNATVVSVDMNTRRNWRAERIGGGALKDALHSLALRLREFYQATLSGGLADPEYPAGHPSCRRCPFRSACGNATPPAKQSNIAVAPPATPEEAARRAQEYLRLKGVERDAKEQAAGHYEALKLHLGRRDRIGLGGKFRVSRHPQTTRRVDYQTLRQLDSRIFDRVVSESYGERIRITGGAR